MKTIRILILRLRVGLLQIERSMRLDSVLTTYSATPDQLTDETVREVLRDVDEDIAAAQARIAELKAEPPEEGHGPMWPAWLLAAVLAVVLVALSGCGEPPRPEVSAVTPSGYRVERLFSVDGCTVYRFNDSGSRYFTNCSGSTGWEERAGKATRPAGVVGGRQA